MTILRDGKKVGDFASTELDNEKLVYFMTGKNITSTNFTCSVNNDNEAEKPLLEVKKLSRKGNFIDINFKLYSGERYWELQGCLVPAEQSLQLLSLV